MWDGGRRGITERQLVHVVLCEDGDARIAVDGDLHDSGGDIDGVDSAMAMCTWPVTASKSPVLRHTVDATPPAAHTHINLTSVDLPIPLAPTTDTQTRTPMQSATSKP